MPSSDAGKGRARRVRLDQLLVDRRLVESRSRAQALILAGQVRVGTTTMTKAGDLVAADAAITVLTPPRFVSRGGEKLDHALETFGLDVAGRVCADFGASTGGFTDCLLQRGAARVYAIDVGYGQLDYRIRQDARVVVMDRTNARAVSVLPEPVSLAVIDVSFISLALVLPSALAVTVPAGEIVALIKPQFEAGKGAVGRGGVVRDPETHRTVLQSVASTAASLALRLNDLTASPLRGPAGNLEFLAWWSPGMPLGADETAARIVAALATVPGR
ncbi:MAG: TlyA family RNA methyltransferase [Thermomicrobia bacterium]|nr:TlyA family RNA methyltransferase [Thermomicrobia bacterium]